MKAFSLLGIAGLFFVASAVPADAFDVVINEFLADPAPDLPGDANGDGVRDSSEDEFVEIYNDTGGDLDMSNWEIHDGVALRHVFPDGTVVADGCAIVVFGGGTPTGSFGGTEVQTASTGFLGFNNGGDTVELKDDGGVTMAIESYPPPDVDDQSMTRDPDITGGFVGHSDAAGSGGALFSPGTMVDGSQFSGCPVQVVINEIHADPAPDLPGDANGDGVRDSSEDEFVEIFNDTGGELDMSDWEIHDAVALRHVFPQGTIIPNQCAVLVFGGGTPTGSFGDAVVQTATGGFLGFNNGGDTVELKDDGGVTIALVVYPPPNGGNNQSITRDPDITGGFVEHTNANGSGGALFSPGTMIDGTSFSGCVEAEPACGDLDAGDCFEANGTPFCSDEECCLAVCEVDPFCCDTEWNAACADVSLVECRSCGDPVTGDCFQDNGTPYCRDESCCSTVCAMNPACCEGAWDQNCASMAIANCAWDAPECGDVVFGLSEPDPVVSMELVRGAAAENGGAQLADFWDGPFTQSVEFDNLDGIAHNPQGNLLGVNFGSSASGGSISSFATCSPPGAGALIGDTQGLGGDIDQTRLGGLSISPNNDKIAVTGFDSGAVIVYNYNPGDCLGNGAALSDARQTDAGTLCTFSTQGTAWKDNDTVLAFSALGDIFEVDADSMDVDLITTVDTVTGCGGFTDIEFAPGISDNVYGMYSRFTGGATHNLLFVLDPANNLDVLGGGPFDYATSMQTAREIAFDVDGNLFISQFGDFGNTLRIEFIPNGADLGSLADNNSLDWYTSGSESNFNGLDVAQCETAIEVPVDIKPGSCPNPMNTHSNGVVPVSVLSTDTFDASEIVISSVQICRADGVGSCVSPNEGPPGPHSVFADTATQFNGEPCNCHELTGDGLIDLSLKFRTQNMVAAMQLDSEPGGSFIEMVVKGTTQDGGDFVGRDCVVVVPPGGGQANATMQSNVSDTFIDVTPLDLNVDSDGFANFSRSYVSGTVVTVTAPTTSQGRRFLRWSVDNVLQPFGVRTMEVTVGENTTLNAYYQRASRIRPDRPSAPSGDQE